ncbi:hypothetical protein FOZ62_009123, partial [Perkinsus olseni]
LKHVHKLGSPMELIKPGMNQWTSDVCRMFAGAADEYAARHCADDRQKFCRYLADITVKNRAHGTQNPDAAYLSGGGAQVHQKRHDEGESTATAVLRINNGADVCKNVDNSPLNGIAGQ